MVWKYRCILNLSPERDHLRKTDQTWITGAVARTQGMLNLHVSYWWSRRIGLWPWLLRGPYQHTIWQYQGLGSEGEKWSKHKLAPGSAFELMWSCDSSCLCFIDLTTTKSLFATRRSRWVCSALQFSAEGKAEVLFARKSRQQSSTKHQESQDHTVFCRFLVVSKVWTSWKGEGKLAAGADVWRRTVPRWQEGRRRKCCNLPSHNIFVSIRLHVGVVLLFSGVIS